jgi:membrane-associated phospholipid phosphatase
MSSAAAPSQRLARAVSILGHPLLVLPFSILLLAAEDGDARQLARLAAGFAAFAALVMSYSWWQVRQRRWAHVDASALGERRSLNGFLLLALAIAAPLAWSGGMHGLALGLALSALMIVVALASARWCMLSLHVAFAVFAATLLWRMGMLAAVAGWSVAALIAWSRLQLARHAWRDVVAGTIVGAAAGLAFLLFSAAMGG